MLVLIENDNYLLEREEGEDTNFKPDYDWFKHMYSKFNDEFFDGKLPSCDFKIDNSSKHVGLASCRSSRYEKPMYKDYGNGKFVGHLCISLSKHFDNMTRKEGEEVLLHEMIHIYQYTQLNWFSWNNKSKYRGAHGYTFLNKMEEINKKGGYNITTTNDSTTQARHNFNDKDFKKALKQKLVFWEHKYNEHFIMLFNNENDCKYFCYRTGILKAFMRDGNTKPVHICSIIDLQKCKDLKIMPHNYTRKDSNHFKGVVNKVESYDKAIAEGIINLDYDIDIVAEKEKMKAMDAKRTININDLINDYERRMKGDE